MENKIEKINEIHSGDVLFIKNKKTQENKWVLFDYADNDCIHCYWIENEVLCDDFLKITDYIFSKEKEIRKNMTSIVLKQSGDTYLIARIKPDGKICEFVLCRSYNQESDEWYWGHYFQELDDALNYFNQKIF